MRKSIRKPSNWQDFETLCKMLWGEIWKIPDKIKKNGRLGQPQSGVDIYGIPKDKMGYSAIQCKGKDDYVNASLSEKEIEEEIVKAKMFTPAIETFIFATTANKDVNLEAYIRTRDMENREAGSFEILLFCWEDIADLIEVNRHTFNYYVLDNQFKSNYQMLLSFVNGEQTCVVKPWFKKKVTKYSMNVKNNELRSMNTLLQTTPLQNINKSWTSIELRFANTGSVVIEDYKLFIYPEVDKIRNLKGFLGNPFDMISFLKNSPLYVYEDEKYAVYKRNDNAPLVQKDERSFKLYFLPLLSGEKYTIKVEYEFLARDFDQKGELMIEVDPQFETEENVVKVYNTNSQTDDKIEIVDLKVAGPLF